MAMKTSPCQRIRNLWKKHNSNMHLSQMLSTPLRVLAQDLRSYKQKINEKHEN